MGHSYVTSVFLQGQSSHLYALFGWSQREKLSLSHRSWLSILEIFIHTPDLQDAFQIYQQSQMTSLSEKALQNLASSRALLDHSGQAVVSLTQGKLILYTDGLKGIVDQGTQVDLSGLSQETVQVLPSLFAHLHLEDDRPKVTTLEDFKQRVQHLNDLGLLAPAIGSVDWGDFRRKAPMCHACAFTRGTPIDRYYLSQFVQEIDAQVVGNVLEIGAVPKDRDFYDFSDRPSYRVLNLEAGPGVDLVGDVHTATLIEPNTLDSVVIFNVLEHCYAPWQAVQNIHQWLKVGGKCFALVPNAQRLHDRPADYWRPLPDGMALLFKAFDQQQLYVYGNPTSVVGIFHGIAAEELTPEELNAVHPDYPVLTCIVAQK